MASRISLYLAAAASVVACANPALAQEEAAPQAAVAPPPRDPPKPQLTGMLGDWGGLRTDLKGAGITINAELTGYANTLIDGEGRDDIAPSGRFDLLADFSTEKLGLWNGGMIRTHTEIRFGETRTNFGGALIPQNAGALLPLPLDGKGRVVASSIYLAQSLGPRTMLLAGKINALDLLANDPVLGGWATKRFQNVAFVAPVSGVLPPTVMGAVLVHQSKPVSWTFMVTDPNDRTNDYWVDGLFKRGVNWSAAATWSGSLSGRPASVSLTTAFSSKRGSDLGEVLLPPDLRSGGRKGSYNIALAATHRLAESTQVKGKGLDLYVEAAVADGNPNPLKNSLTLAVAGHGLIGGRPHDSFGIGAYWYDFSDDLQDAAAPIADFDNELGVEAWYSLGLAPWFNLTADLQLDDPASGDRPTALVGGLRVNVNF